jgi:hypothetical protein
MTIDEAMGAFQAMVQEELGDASDAVPGLPETPEAAEARRFRMAEYLLGLACPDPAACTDHRCRRDAVCRHLAFVRGRQASGQSSHPRRTAGAEAVRHAIWVYMSSPPEPQ